jgi:hypothetical protein
VRGQVGRHGPGRHRAGRCGRSRQRKVLPPAEEPRPVAHPADRVARRRTGSSCRRRTPPPNDRRGLTSTTSERARRGTSRRCCRKLSAKLEPVFGSLHGADRCADRRTPAASNRCTTRGRCPSHALRVESPLKIRRRAPHAAPKADIRRSGGTASSTQIRSNARLTPKRATGFDERGSAAHTTANRGRTTEHRPIRRS